jgi:hypothetical protein
MARDGVAIYVDTISINGSGGEVTGNLSATFRPVRATVDYGEAKRLRAELIAGLERPELVVSIDAIKWLGEADSPQSSPPERGRTRKRSGALPPSPDRDTV